MNAPPSGRPAPVAAENSVVPENGWHCGHYFYRFDRATNDGLMPEPLRGKFREALHPQSDAPERLAAYWISGHEVDFGFIAMDPNPAKVDQIHQRLLAAGLGRYVVPAWSFISVSEVSEYVPSIDE